MNYKEFIDNILTTRGRFACGDEYKERHHIVPRCMGGTNDKDNLIDLYAREHFEAHRLLALENPDNDDLEYAWWMMCNAKNKKQKRYIVTAEEYEEAKRRIAKTLSKNMAGEGNNFFGKHHSEEQKKKWSETRKDNVRSEDAIKKQSETCKTVFLGSGNNFFGKHHSEEQKKKWSETRKGAKNPSAKPICQFDIDFKPIRCWTHIKSATSELNIGNYSIGSCCANKQKSAGGYKWKYLYDQTKRDGTIIQGAISLGLITEEYALKMLKEQNSKTLKERHINEHR